MLDTLTKSAMDTIQTSKKIFVDAFFKDEKLNKALHGFVDAQGEYTRAAYDTMKNTGHEVFSIVSKPSFYTDTFKDVQAQVNNLFKTNAENTEKKGK